MKTRTHKLDYRHEFEFKLLAISSHENDYHLSWSLNDKLGMAFERWDDLIIESGQADHQMKFSVYRYEDPDSQVLYHLISNVSAEGFLLPELKNMDFFLQIYGDQSDDSLQDLAGQMIRLPVISACFLIDPRKLKSAFRLFFI